MADDDVGADMLIPPIRSRKGTADHSDWSRGGAHQDRREKSVRKGKIEFSGVEDLENQSGRGFKRCRVELRN
jgi:hypothetical protein